MSAGGLEHLAAWLAAPLMAAALGAAFAAALSRTLLALALYVCMAASAAAAAVLALNEADAALALSVAAGVWAPVLLLMGISLGGRVAKSARRRRPYASAALALGLGATLIWAARGQASLPADIVASIVRGGASIGPWLAVLAFVAAAACVALIGYGERGAFERGGAGRLE